MTPSQLRQKGSRLEALFEHSPDMINVHDAAGNIIDLNPRLVEKTGYDRGALTGMKVWDLDETIDRETARTLWRGMDHGDRERLEGVYRRRDGSTLPVEVHIRRLDLDGDDRFLVISREISERREHERELGRQNERLEEFASVVSHDLRNPLNVAQARLELLAEDCDSEHVEPATGALERMGRIIEDVLWLAREGKDIGSTEAVGLREAVDSAWEIVADDADGAGLVADLAGPAEIEADRSRLGQLLENLFRNSIEHGGSDVTVTVGALDGGFYVADDGPGIPAENRERLFEAGYSTSQEGTGFGLSIVEQIAEAHGWAVAVTEDSGGGARFEVTGVEFVER